MATSKQIQAAVQAACEGAAMACRFIKDVCGPLPETKERGE